MCELPLFALEYSRVLGPWEQVQMKNDGELNLNIGTYLHIRMPGWTLGNCRLPVFSLTNSKDQHLKRHLAIRLVIWSLLARLMYHIFVFLLGMAQTLRNWHFRRPFESETCHLYVLHGSSFVFDTRNAWKSIERLIWIWGLFLESPETFRAYFGWHNSLCIFKTKASRGTKLCSYFCFYSLYNIWKDQLYRISRSHF